MIMKHLVFCFDGADALADTIRRTRTLSELLYADRALFDFCPLRKDPAFIPEPSANTRISGAVQ